MKKTLTIFKTIGFLIILQGIGYLSYGLNGGMYPLENQHKVLQNPVEEGMLMNLSITDSSRIKGVFEPQILGLDKELHLNQNHYNRQVGEWFPVYLHPLILYADSVAWFTSGDGTFDFPVPNYVAYHLGTLDNWSKKITLTVKAFALAGSSVVVVDSMHVFVPSQIIDIRDNGNEGGIFWTGLSSYLDKSDTPVPEVVEPLVGPGPGSENLVLMLNKNGQYYWPQPTPPINQLGNWSPIGYKAKLQYNDYLCIDGDFLSNQSVHINGSYIYLPVLTNFEVSFEELFAGHYNKILMIFDWNTGNIWTPEASSLNSLEPGKAYAVLTNGSQNFTIEYPDFDLNAPLLSPVSADADYFPPIWDEPVNTGDYHGIIVKLIANPRINDIPVQQGDYIGGFFLDLDGNRKCGGASVWSGTENIAFSLFKDNPATPGIKEGFSYSETIEFRIFNRTTGKDYVVDNLTFDTQNYPSSNKWYPSGLSCITNMQALEVIDFYINVSENPICPGSELILSAQEFIGNGGPSTFNWTSNPPGFSSTLQYPPSVFLSETTTFFLTVSNGTFVSEHETEIRIAFNNPIVNPGNDMTVCDNQQFIDIEGSLDNSDYFLWTTAGTGFFNEEDKLDTYYCPGFEDIISGSVDVCLYAWPINPACGVPVEECFTLYFIKAPICFAGSDATICKGENYPLIEAFAQNYSDILWTSQGDGTFDNPANMNPVYFPGDNDNAAGNVVLCLEAFGNEGCTLSFENCMTLTLADPPYLNLPACDSLDCEFYDFVNNEWMPVHVTATASNVSAVQWSTSGDGFFTNPDEISPFYNLGVSDILNGQVELTVLASGIGSCQLVNQKTITLFIPHQLISIESDGWRGISSYLDLSSFSVPDVLRPVEACLNQVSNQSGQVYTPGGTNDLGNWAACGYKTKFDCAACLPLFGNPLQDKTFQITDTIVYLPVLSEFPVGIDTLFAGHVNELELIYDWETGNFWFPDGYVYNLEILHPGKAYTLKTTGQNLPFTITFSETPAPVLQIENQNISETLVQGEVLQTQLNISNLGLGTLNYSVSITPDDGKSIEWLNVSPLSGTIWSNNSNQLSLTFDANRLLCGQHSAILTITSNDLTSPVLEIPVTMTVARNRTLLFEPFEAYNTDEKLALQATNMGYDFWTTWSNSPGSVEDPYVKSDVVFEGSRAVCIDGLVDVVLAPDSYTEGSYNIELFVNIPTGKTGYFNLLQKFAGIGTSWGMQTYFKPGGIGKVDAGGFGAGAFTFTYDTWHKVSVDIDLEKDSAQMFINDNSVVEWKWSKGINGAGTLKEFNAMNFFAWSSSGTPGAYYDNIKITRKGIQTIYTDSLALVALYNSTNGPGWTNNTNWLTGPVNTWHGITVENGRVTGINLGEFPGNNLSGTIPTEIGELTKLESLNLSYNELTGNIPETIEGLVNLKNLFLHVNQLTGNIPESIGNMGQLESLYLHVNQLSGNIPESIGYLSNLTSLVLSENRLSGSIPSSLGSLINLTTLVLYSNQLSGIIPASVENLVNLQEAYFDNNLLENISSSDFCTNLTNLTTLTLQQNNLGTEDCPIIQCLIERGGWGNFEHSPQNDGFVFMEDCGPSLYTDSLALVALYNSTDGPNWTNNENWLVGPVSSWYGIDVEYGRVVDISLSGSLNVWGNSLTGTIPNEVGELSELKYLHLGENNLNGIIPEAIGSLKKLEALALDYNQLSGSIPELFANLSSLQKLYLNNNNFTGSIPESIGYLSSLQDLNLSNNQLSGSIPVVIGNLYLYYLELDNNQLSGNIPESLCNNVSIKIDLSHNQLNGVIPESIRNCYQVYLHNNFLEGPIPTSFCYSTGNIYILKLSNNNFGQDDCAQIQCLIENVGTFFAHSPQNDGFVFMDDCVPPAAITNATAAQRTDGSKLLDVYYDLTGSEPAYDVAMQVSFDDGQNYQPVAQVSGDAGTVSPGTGKQITWDAGAEFPDGFYSQTMKFRILADIWECGNLLTDIRDGQEYTTVQIGDQCWMAENLNIGTRVNGSVTMTDNGTIEKYCYDNSESNCDIYGGLYQWNEMMQYSTISPIGMVPPGWGFSLTPKSMTIAIPTSMNPSINGSPLEAGDFIGVFYVDDVGNLACGGVVEWSGTSNVAIVAFGDSSLTGTKNGFEEGEFIHYKVYSWSMQKEYDASVSCDDCNHFYNGALSAIESLNAFGAGSTGTQGICPEGWHFPTDNEWTSLTTFLGGESVAGGKMKETGTTHWYSPNTGATNSSGFTALPGGFRDTSGTFYGISYGGNWWSSTELSTTYAWYRYMLYDGTYVYRDNDFKGYGFSVRCLRD